MVYLSKGILPRKPSPYTLSVSHCGLLHKLVGTEAELWLAGRYGPRRAVIPESCTALELLAEKGVVELHSGDSGYSDSVYFRLLINCIICPVRVKSSITVMKPMERVIWRWIRNAGLRLTIAELTLITERGIKPVRSLLGEGNRQPLTEEIYTTDTISDGILESMMEKSPARDETVHAGLGLLEKKKIYIV